MSPERAKALAAGERTYLPDQPCSRGHLTKRQTSNGACLECAKIAARRRKLKHPEEHRQKLKRAKVNTQRNQRLREILEHFAGL